MLFAGSISRQEKGLRMIHIPTLRDQYRGRGQAEVNFHRHSSIIVVDTDSATRGHMFRAPFYSSRRLTLFDQILILSETETIAVCTARLLVALGLVVVVKGLREAPGKHFDCIKF
jgi:hypothetical protein